MMRVRTPTATLVLLFTAAAPMGISAAEQSVPDEPSIRTIMQRLDALERENRALAARVDELTRQNEAMRAEYAPAIGTVAETTPAEKQSTDLEWASRIRFGGDLRFRHENIDDESLADDRTRETVRARFGATIKVTESIDGEIAIASGGNDPRGGSATLGAASSRKDIGLDLAYMSWRPLEGLAVTAGKMRQPFARPGLSAFIDNEIRPEGVAVSFQRDGGLFASAFRFWLEERPVNADSTLSGMQTGWESTLGDLKLRVGAGYYDYGNVQGRLPGFGGGIVDQLGNTVVGSGPSASYAYDYDIGQLFAEGTFPLGHVPLSLFADYARNSEADNGLDSAYNVGFLVGKANSPGRWEAGAFTQRVEKDALFGQWTDSDFAGGVTDNRGQVYRAAWMALQNLLINLTYIDASYDIDAGSDSSYERWQLDFNFMF